MNYKMIVYILGKMLGVEGGLLLIPATVSLIYGEKSGFSFLIVSAVLFLIFMVFGQKVPKNKMIYGKEGMAIVGLAWILWALFGAIPFVLSSSIPNYLDAFFETVSGFTTTGSTILTDIEALPKGILFWRSFTHWVGGMGVLVFVMMLTTLDDENSMQLMRAEVPGPVVGKLVPKARSTARILYTMYFVLTAALIFFLLLGGMNLYDALIHSFSVAGTGGFTNRNASVSYYDSAYIEGVLSVFMVLFGVNFNLYFLLWMKNGKAALKDGELRAYLGIIGGAIAIITINTLNIYGNVIRAFRYAAFQVTTIITTTGFYSVDFDIWPQLSKVVLLALMIIGACAGSTGGGIKVSRLVILLKSIKQEMKKMFHSKSVTVVKMNGKRLSKDTVHGVYVYFICYVMIMLVSILLVSINDYDLTTTVSAVLTTLNNVGPGLELAGPVESFHIFSPLSKVVFCIDMLLGRLEIFPYLLLASPEVWRRRF